MDRWITLSHEPIDASDVVGRATTQLAGAVVLFLGTTRGITDGRQTLSLDYEAYGQMAEKKLHELADQAAARWPIVRCAIVHRVGTVAPGEASVAVAVSTPHRRDAFEAGQWLIDALKESVPIWKREQWADGTTEWVHPGLSDSVPTTSPPGPMSELP